MLNTGKLTLGEARITSASLKEEIVQSSTALKFDEGRERVAIQLPVILPAGSHIQLKLDFAAELTGSLLGYYRSAWEFEGKTKYYALTQFQVGLRHIVE